MQMLTRSRTLISLLLALTLVLVACGQGNQESAPEAEAPAAQAPLAQEEPAAEAEAETEEMAEEEEAVEAEGDADDAAEDTAADDTTADNTATDDADDAEGAVFTAVDEYLTTIPEGFMSVGGVDAFKEMLDATDVYLIDVRTPGEYAEGYIANGVNIPLRTLGENLDQIPTDQPVVVYCASGHRAAMATTALRTLGYDNVRAFPASFNGWTDAGEEVSTEPTEAGTFETPEIDPAVVEAVNTFLTNIPEGYYANGAADDLQEMMDAGAMTLIDVREPGEWEDGIIAGAVTMPIRTLTENLDQIPTDQTVVTYCASGFRAALSTAALQILGYENARAFPPSFSGWADAGGEIAQVQ